MEIIFATFNKDKQKEFKELLIGSRIKILFLDDLNEPPDKVLEVGKSFSENAQIKAEYYYQKYHKPVLSDDSGLVIPAFNNRPGIYSARYAGKNATSYENNQKLLEDIKDLEDRRAYFICKICFIIDNLVHFFTGKLDGTIAFDLQGTEGFGYDPLFILNNGKRLSEIPLHEKNKISHRAQAFQKWLEFIKDGGIY